MDAGFAQAPDDPALEALRAYIAHRPYNRGDRLPPERQLIEDLNISRNALRRALDTLENEGQIWRHVGKGTFVASLSTGRGDDHLAQVVHQTTPIELMRARMAIEPAIAQEAARNASAAAITRLQVALERSQQAQNWRDFRTQGMLFHRTVAEATGNGPLLELYLQLKRIRRAISERSTVSADIGLHRDHLIHAEHQRIAAAIAGHDPEAAGTEMRPHLANASARQFDS